MYKLLALSSVVWAALLTSAVAQTQHHSNAEKARWLWVKDYITGIGVPTASVDIGPGDKCLGHTGLTDVNWTAHYTTNAAGRVLVRGLPQKLSCRVTVDGRPLYVLTYGFEIARAQNLPTWISLRNDYTTTIFVSSQARDDRTLPPDYWETNDPTKFRSYIRDPDTAQLIPGVGVTAVPSGVSTTTDANGLFTLEVAASYRKGKFPSMATQTLVFSKPSYKTFEYRQLVLRPGLVQIDVFLPKGTGTLVRTNGSIYPGDPYDDQFEAYPGEAPEHLPSGRGEILSFEIRPFTYDGGWITCGKGAKAILKAHNLTKVGIGWTPTGTGVTESVGLDMLKISTSPEGDTWEVALSDIMSTRFAAGGVDNSGKTVRSMDLSNVYCE